MVDNEHARRLSEKIEKARQDSSSIGSILVKKGYVTADQLDSAIARQLESPRLGEILIEMGHLSRWQLEDALFEQKITRGEVKNSELALARLQHQRTMLQHATEGFGEIAHMMQSIVSKCAVKK